MRFCSIFCQDAGVMYSRGFPECCCVVVEVYSSQSKNINILNILLLLNLHHQKLFSLCPKLQPCLPCLIYNLKRWTVCFRRRENLKFGSGSKGNHIQSIFLTLSCILYFFFFFWYVYFVRDFWIVYYQWHLWRLAAKKQCQHSRIFKSYLENCQSEFCII